ncbi:DUF4270 domain-containing protein [Yeosuana marina]|uniref:DUF4270 domain-containing protein n=2 Tax=Yeosuana marina TaxID=1565536 RepID=UPI0030EF8610
MKKIFKALKFTSVFLLIAATFIGCDKEFNTIESDVIGVKNFETDHALVPITSFNKKLDSLQINNLPTTELGVFNDPVYGQTKASIIAQVVPTSFSPSFGDNPAIDSVVLSIPYYSKTAADSPDADGNTVYSISDSLYGTAPIKLSVYQNNYFLRDFDPNSQTNEAQKFYSHANGDINTTDNFAITESGSINFDDFKGDLIYENGNFTPSSDAIVEKIVNGDTETLERSIPALRVMLDPTFWKTAIIDKEGSTELSNGNSFKNYFRGLYFKAEAIGNDGNMVMLNLRSSASKITIYYSYDSTITTGERLQSTYTLNFTGNILNTFINDYSSVPLANGDKTNGDEKLYLKGAEGSMAEVDLFTGAVDYNGEQISALDAFKKTYRAVDANGNYIVKNGKFELKKLINEAQLVVYEDENMTAPVDYHKYDRLYAYDIKNNIPLIDYNNFYDPTGNSTDPLNSKYVHLGQRQTDDNGISKYKIRLTEHLNNILLRDSTNTKIGLVLSTNVNETSSSDILNSHDAVTGVPSASIINPRGTVLYGSNQNVPDNRRMELEVFFTDPK